MLVHVVVPVDIGETVASVTESWSDRACDLLGGLLEEVFSTNDCVRLATVFGSVVVECGATLDSLVCRRVETHKSWVVVGRIQTLASWISLIWVFIVGDAEVHLAS